MRHWLFTDGDGTLSIERAPSPDGTTEGALLWYDYANNTAATTSSPATAISPRSSLRSFRCSTHYSYSLRGAHLNVTNEISTYTALNGSVALRTMF